LKKIKEKIVKTEEGQKVLKEKPNIHSSTVDLQALKSLPEGIFYIFF